MRERAFQFAQNGGLLCRLHDPLRDCVGIHFASDIHETAFTKAAEPCGLALGEAARADFDAGDQFRAAYLPAR